MDKTDFFNGRHLNRLNAEFKAFINSHTWEKPRHAIVSIQEFAQMDRFNAGRNGVSDVVQLVTKTMEADSIYFDKSGRRGYVSLYLQAGTRSNHGFGSDGQSMLIVFRDSKGRRDSVEVQDAWDSDKIEVERILRLVENQVFKGLKYWSHKHQDRKARIIKRLQHELKYHSSMARGKLSKVIQYLFKRSGLELIECIPFTHRYWGLMYTTKYIKNSKARIEFGMKSVSTYCSLPWTLTIELRKSELNLIKLCDLGVEEAGYYSHHDNMKIRPEHLKQVKAFHKRFKTLEKRG